MRMSEVPELHCIMPITNVTSVVAKGILCHQLAAKISHQDVSMQKIQNRRAQTTVPGGRPLHEYANLYIHARNPMMYVRQERHLQLCVLRISTNVLYLPGVIIADGNAASGYTRFYESPGGLDQLDSDFVLAEWWNDQDVAAK